MEDAWITWDGQSVRELDETLGDLAFERAVQLAGSTLHVRVRERGGGGGSFPQGALPAVAHHCQGASTSYAPPKVVVFLRTLGMGAASWEVFKAVRAGMEASDVSLHCQLLDAIGQRGMMDEPGAWLCDNVNLMVADLHAALTTADVVVARDLFMPAQALDAVVSALQRSLRATCIVRDLRQLALADGHAGCWEDLEVHAPRYMDADTRAACFVAACASYEPLGPVAAAAAAASGWSGEAAMDAAIVVALADVKQRRRRRDDALLLTPSVASGGGGSAARPASADDGRPPPRRNDSALQASQSRAGAAASRAVTLVLKSQTDEFSEDVMEGGSLKLVPVRPMPMQITIMDSQPPDDVFDVDATPLAMGAAAAALLLLSDTKRPAAAMDRGPAVRAAHVVGRGSGSSTDTQRLPQGGGGGAGGSGGGADAAATAAGAAASAAAAPRVQEPLPAQLQPRAGHWAEGVWTDAQSGDTFRFQHRPLPHQTAMADGLLMAMARQGDG